MEPVLKSKNIGDIPAAGMSQKIDLIKIYGVDKLIPHHVFHDRPASSCPASAMRHGFITNFIEDYNFNQRKLTDVRVSSGSYKKICCPESDCPFLVVATCPPLKSEGSSSGSWKEWRVTEFVDQHTCTDQEVRPTPRQAKFLLLSSDTTHSSPATPNKRKQQTEASTSPKTGPKKSKKEVTSAYNSNQHAEKDICATNSNTNKNDSGVIDANDFELLRNQMIEYDEKREQIIQRSRRITKLRYSLKYFLTHCKANSISS